ncbi:peptidylprolyl isomerase [Paraneptunicella aestuarii]|uniref:FKBP-type peptidyl-prolyl cis-trans isomerase n=1 Tax=Paraneptunicella aestuarii TaxID=2831148 RepID=UPI001E378436|nr:peptidylprolyl isomerase [Paraneptunicella aestuarii]UAA40064.1 peptidylprolyl isomerase [Paraneptunicella aestuarii]
MKIAQDTVVAIHYTVSTPDGVDIDSTAGDEPLQFLFGHGQLIIGLENALLGREAGEKMQTTVPAADAYGERHDQLVQAVPKNMFEGMEPQVGMQFRASTDHGDQSVIIIDVSEDHVVVDGNHPLAGHDLSFDVEVVSVRPATAEEVQHGHAHSPGGCGHNH